MKYPNTFYTAALSAFLVVPFAIRFLAPVMEPYPAVLLPAGAGKIKTAENQLDFEQTAIYGKAAGRDEWTRLVPSQFLDPIPPEFFPPLAQRYFGLSPRESGQSWTRLGFVTTDGRKIREDDVKNAKAWFRARLNASGCDDKLLRITEEIVTFRRSDAAEIAVRYQNDKLFELR